MKGSARKSKLEELAKKIIASREIYGVSNVLEGRSKRKIKEVGEEIYERLKRRERLPEKSGLVLELRWSDKAAGWARNLVLAIEEFKQEYPKYGKILEEIIKKHREVRRAYLEFGYKNKGWELPEEVYIKVAEEIVGDKDKARKVYEFVKEMESSLDRKKRKKEEKFTYLLPE